MHLDVHSVVLHMESRVVCRRIIKRQFKAEGRGDLLIMNVLADLVVGWWTLKQWSAEPQEVCLGLIPSAICTSSGRDGDHSGSFSMLFPSETSSCFFGASAHAATEPVIKVTIIIITVV